MARPRLVKFGDNSEVKLTNVTKELADKITDLVHGGTSSAVTQSEETEPATKEETKSNFNHTAVGTFQSQDHLWCVAVLKFDPLTGAAKVDRVVTAGLEKDEANERFRILAVTEKAV